MAATSANQDVQTIDGSALSIDDVWRVACAMGSSRFECSPDLASKMQKSVNLVDRVVSEEQTIYGVTTGFGGMAGVTVSREQAAASQNNLLAFLATGAGDPIDRRHVRAAMLLRANVLAQGCSGVRLEIVERLLRFLEADAIPVVRELGSIGASGDLVPLSTIARAITGHSRHVKVQLGDRMLGGDAALTELGLPPLALLPKEGLALVNGTSFSAAIAANSVSESRTLMALTFGVQAMMLKALQVQEDPFAEFVHQRKPHPGQCWSAKTIRRLLSGGSVGADSSSKHVQDRYSLRCLPQYMGATVESMARISDIVETEMNGVSDNPLIDASTGAFYQSGNFLGQYLALAMDDLRKHLGLMAKHLDVQIAMLVTPEFSGGLSASLQGNADVPYNMGLKGLQITGNSIMPMLTWYGNPIVEHFPTHAEQFNQNINGLSWGSANLAWKSVGLFKHYLSVGLIFAVQALDLRSKSVSDHYDGRQLLGDDLCSLYEATCASMGVRTGGETPFVFNDSEQSLEERLNDVHTAIDEHGPIVQSVQSILDSFDDSF